MIGVPGRWLLVGVAVGLLFLGGCSASRLEPTAASDPALASFYDQEIIWVPCPDVTALECGTLSVPLDYARPDGATVAMALYRAPATSGQAQGTVVIGPGGPGERGVDYIAPGPGSGFQELNRDQDLVSYDARAIGATLPFHCESNEDRIARLSLDATPDTPDEEAALAAAEEAYSRGCQDAAGDALGFVGTRELVGDLDVMRAALGENALTFFGISYGTLVGSQYALAFPQRVGRMVLDAPRSGDHYVDAATIKAMTSRMESSLDEALATCFDNPFLPCRLGADQTQARARVEALLLALDAEPATTTNAGLLTRERAVGVVWNMLAGGRDAWEQLVIALDRAVQGDWSNVVSLEHAGFATPTPDAWAAITCTDVGPSEQTPAQRAEWAATWAQAFPVFGETYGRLLPCAGWPVGPTLDVRTDPVRPAGPVLIVTSAGDPLTPPANVSAMSTLLDDAPVLTYNGPGHVAYWHSDCTRFAVNDFLTTGTAPAGDTC